MGNQNLSNAFFGGGCFWCLEAVFQRAVGVVSVVSGYMGGPTPAPTYEAICSGRTGHAEVVRVTFDPTLIRYEDLLDLFFLIHDPTTPDRQGNDVGSQYRSIVFALGAQQAAAAALACKEYAGQHPA
ncbi:MAG: peptide-methionine (S)-S-oxide reductase MsrA, partial [Proteobacteria bacterium]|nr:peptide-methionine (S)-S-oxide reductase MsrA [Pseudomonadota bacterium]